jgi:DHA1 family inner membrane transport protein
VASSFGNAPLAVFANACGALVGCLYVPALGTAIYNQAKRSPCPLRFHIAAEGGWDIGGAGACLIEAALLALGVPIGVGIMLSLVGGIGTFVLLRRYFAASHPVVELAQTSELATS